MHDIRTKARAMAMLLTGDAPAHVADVLGVPRRTIRRWRAEAFNDYLPAIVLPRLDLRGLLGDAAAQQNGHKNNAGAQ